MHFEKAGLLAYAHGEYYALGERLGRFGFSTDKPKKQAKAHSEKELDKAEPKNSKAESQEAPRRPFYESAPKTKARPKKQTDKNKGAPHGKRKENKK